MLDCQLFSQRSYLVHQKYLMKCYKVFLIGNIMLWQSEIASISSCLSEPISITDSALWSAKRAKRLYMYYHLCKYVAILKYAIGQLSYHDITTISMFCCVLISFIAYFFPSSHHNQSLPYLRIIFVIQVIWWESNFNYTIQ